MCVNVGEKYTAVKKIWFLNEGTIVEVTNVGNDGIVSFVFGDNNTNNGYMDSATFAEHFEKVVDNTMTEYPIVTEELIREIMENSEFEINTVFDKCTVVSCRLPNGFVIVESSSCVSPENYNEEIGADICFDKIADKIFELEAYKLHDELYRYNVMNQMEEQDCDCGCVECPCGICDKNEHDEYDKY